MGQGLVKGAILCFRNPYFYFQHGESTSRASQLTSPASQKSKDLNNVSLFLQDLDNDKTERERLSYCQIHKTEKNIFSVTTHLIVS